MVFIPTPCNPPFSPNNPQFDPNKCSLNICGGCSPVQNPIYPYGYVKPIPLNPSPWPTTGNPNPTNQAAVPDPSGSSLISVPGTVYGG